MTSSVCDFCGRTVWGAVQVTGVGACRDCAGCILRAERRRQLGRNRRQLAGQAALPYLFTVCFVIVFSLLVSWYLGAL